MPKFQATKSGLGGGKSSKQTGGLAEQARIAEGQRVAVETELRQLEMREKHLTQELSTGQKQLSAMEAKSGGLGKDGGEAKRKQLLSQMENLKAQLEELRLADDKAGGDEATITSKLFYFF